MPIRAYRRTDERAVLALIRADRLTGQPPTTAAMLTEALAGRSSVDSSFWTELEPPVTEVLDDGEVRGVVSYAVRPSDQVGVILWLHCREDLAVASALVGHAVDCLGSVSRFPPTARHPARHLLATAGIERQTLGDRAMVAFDFASALSLGLEALPVRHRPATRTALTAAGFTGEDLWRYMHARLPLAGMAVTAEVEVRPSEESGRLELELLRGGEVVAEATVGEPVGGVGVLWWIGVGTAFRGQGLGSGLLGAALELLAERGAGEVILYVDDDAPVGDPRRDRSAAARMYERAGFREVDRLVAFSRSVASGVFRG